MFDARGRSVPAGHQLRVVPEDGGIGQGRHHPRLLVRPRVHEEPIRAPRADPEEPLGIPLVGLMQVKGPFAVRASHPALDSEGMRRRPRTTETLRRAVGSIGATSH